MGIQMEAQVTKANMEPDVPTARRRRGGFSLRSVKRAAMVLAVIVTLVTLANWIWIMSGSNQWKLAMDKDGTQVYTLKSPGSESLKVQGVRVFRGMTLSNQIASLVDESIQNQRDCAKWVTGCLGYRIIKNFDNRSLSNITLWTVAMFPPFKPREMLLQGQIHQDPDTKVVRLENIAVPNKLPPDDCCVRMNHMDNIWRYTPLPDGSTQVIVVYDLSLGGTFPAILENLHAPQLVFELLSRDIPALLGQQKYRDAHLAFLDESKPVTFGSTSLEASPDNGQ